jgi:urease accessory protein
MLLPVNPPHQQSGRAHLRFERVGDRTRLTQASTRPPLAVMRTLHVDDGMPDLAVAYLLNTTAGVFQGDRLSTDVVAAKGARVHLTTTSATKVFSMASGDARIDTHLEVEDGALLEYLPDPLIPFADARLQQDARLTVHPGGTLFYAEVLAAGRTGMGERLAYTHYGQRLTLEDGVGDVSYVEAFDLRPGDRPLNTLGVLGPYPGSAMATIVIAVPDGAPTLLEHTRAALLAIGPSGAAGLLPSQAGVAIRLLAPDLQPLRAAVHAVWTVFRRIRYDTGVTARRR